jgi:hypothetical protein
MAIYREAEKAPYLPFGSYNLVTDTADVGVGVKGFPEVVYRCWTWHRADTEEDPDVGLEDWPQGVEEPEIGVYFLWVCLLEAKYMT